MMSPSSPQLRSRPFRVLCLDGGGYLALATAAFMSECERHFDCSFSETFDMFCGTSAGGIFALGLADGKSATELMSLLKGVGPRVFPHGNAIVRAWRFVKMFFAAKYPNGPLAAELDRAFGERTLADIRARGKLVVIPAYSVTSGRARVFKTDHGPELSAHGGYRLRDVALATSAAPGYLPVVAVPDPATGTVEHYADGGLFANNPAMMGLVETRTYLDPLPPAVQILSISAPRAVLGDLSPRLGRGVIGWGSTLVRACIDPGVDVAHHAVSRLTRGDPACAYERIELTGRSDLTLDTTSVAATRALVTIGTDTARQIVTRQKLEKFFTNSMTESVDGRPATEI